MANNQSVRRHLDTFTRGRIIGKLEEGRSVTSVAAEFGIAHSIARRNRRQTAGEIARHTTQATGRPISRFTVARRLYGGGLFARRPVRCVPLTPAHRRRHSLWCREHRNWRDNEWGRVLFTDESKFSLSSDSHCILIWRERGSRNHPSNIIEKDRYGGRCVLIWGGIILSSRTDLHIFDAGSVNGTRYCNEILLPYVRLFRGAMGLQLFFMDDNAPCHRTVAADQLLESEDIERMDWPALSPDLNPIEHVWNFLGRRLAARTLPPVTIRELRLALQDKWAAMPQQHIDTLILSMGRRCETCLASTCDTCNRDGPYLWVCLHRDCLYVGCNESRNNHCVKHFQKNNEHSIYLNLTSLRVYCLLCECEVFLENNDPPLPGMLPTHPLILNKPETESEDDCENEENVKPRGLAGLQNLGNTCYMNSAIQALANCPPLTNFFLECGSFVRGEKKPGLAKAYMNLMKEMWHKKRPSYVVPSAIAYGFKIVCPVFRGFAQQDAQEFLRCFMDQLHEELKEPIAEMCAISTDSPDIHEDVENAHADSGVPASGESSQSDGDYETCDSGLSSEKASSSDALDSSQEASVESPDASNETSTVSIHPSLKLSNCNHLSVHCSKISIQKADEKDKDGILTTKEKLSSGKHNVFVQDKKESGLSRDIEDPSESCRCECCRDEKQTNPQITQSNISSRNKGSSVTNQGSQMKHMSPQAILNSIFNAQNKKNVHYRSIISDLFDGKLLSSVQCLTCDTISTTKETFQDLSLPIPNKDHLHIIRASQESHQKSGGTCTDVYNHRRWFSAVFGWVFSWLWGPSVGLQDCLAAFFSADELKGDNMYSCEKCKKLRNGIKYSKVIELPEILCIHLKRFRHEVMYSTKINSYVSFPLEGLDMSAFLHKYFWFERLSEAKLSHDEKSDQHSTQRNLTENIRILFQGSPHHSFRK
ncbi:ubiquitin carboxyl-terminal hydrolase 20 [Trichonephila clavipes]|uniref:ubiquitinyl hydrolase 1 n=1 Tax=Trichonephila clavipes TaxID=2585209 RepID=A0A8X6RRG0_TRICX|nr:ubiquitin carboxyl-terminal hydrolase 20 [Trichonephila clavipes]